MIDQEQKLTLTWLVLPPKEGSLLHPLLLSTPDGEISEFRVSAGVAEKLGPMLDDKELWSTFFHSLINSLEIVEGTQGGLIG